MPRKGAYHAFYLHGTYNGGVTLVESLKRILRRCFVLRNGQSVINKSPDYVGILPSCSNLSSMLHKHISEHSDTVCLFLQLTIENNKLIFSCCSEKIDKVLSTEMKLVLLIEPIVRESLITE